MRARDCQWRRRWLESNATIPPGVAGDQLLSMRLSSPRTFARGFARFRFASAPKDCMYKLVSLELCVSSRSAQNLDSEAS